MDDDYATSLIGLGVVFCGWLLASLIFGWTNVPEATRALRADNLTPITVGDTSWFKCGDDWYATKFTAKNMRGDTVTGVVCSGLLFKATTVRFD